MRPSRPFYASLILLILAAAPSAASPPAFLVEDLAEAPTVALSGPTETIVFQGAAYFVSSTTTTGIEVWRTDGTAAGTRMLADLAPGTEYTSPYEFVEMGGSLYFAAGYNQYLSLWKTDGTAAGTQLVKAFEPGDPYADQTELEVVNGTLFLVAYQPGSGHELWKSDGTPAGTVFVKDIAPGLAGSKPTRLTAHAGQLFFVADDGVHGNELWKSNGTTAGTVLVKDVYPGSASAIPWDIGIMRLASANGSLAFAARDGANGVELWRSDGTTAGTTLLKDIEPGPQDSFPVEFTSYAGALYFAASGTIWRSDGTPVGTAAVYTAQFLYPSELEVSNGILYFAAGDGFDVELGLWRTDGTAAGTREVREFSAGWGQGGVDRLTDVNGTLFFGARLADTGQELWKSDGTEAGTVRVAEIVPGPEDADLYGLTDLGGSLIFGAEDPASHNLALWVSDGTEAGTQVVVPSWPDGAGSEPRMVTDVAGTLFFSTYSNDDANEFPLWRTDGSAAGSTLLTAPYSFVVNPNGPHLAVNGRLFFKAWSSATTFGLGTSDGTLAGTHILTDIGPNVPGSDAAYFASLGNSVFAQTNDGLWKSDGTPAGTSTFEPAGVGLNLSAGTAAMNGFLYLQGTSSLGSELWQTDGTLAGTTLVKDILPGGAHSSPSEFVQVNGLVLFRPGVTFLPEGGGALWRTDGTAAGTVLLKNLGKNAQNNPRFPRQLVNVNGTLFFSVVDGYPYATQLWRSDGTTAGTVMVKQMAGVTGPQLDWNLAFPTASGGTLYFVTDDGVHGRELWKSDGTAAGTELVKDVRPGSGSAFRPTYDFTDPPYLIDIGGAVVFAAHDGVHGEELWVSDGSEAGTRLFADVAAGSGGSDPYGLTHSGQLVYFSAQDDSSGRELYAVPATSDPAVIAIEGTATGGSYQATTLSGVNVTIATIGGQSAAAVAANLAAEISLDATAQTQGIFARASGAAVIVVGANGADVSSFTDDVGLGGEPPEVSATGWAVASALAALLALSAWPWLRASRSA